MVIHIWLCTHDCGDDATDRGMAIELATLLVADILEHSVKL